MNSNCPSDGGRPRFTTPFLLKTGPAKEPLKPGEMRYVQASSGLFLERNTPFYRSCVKAPRWPSGLVSEKESLELNMPRLPRSLLERVVGFFDSVALEGAEAIALLTFHPQAGYGCACNQSIPVGSASIGPTSIDSAMVGPPRRVT